MQGVDEVIVYMQRVQSGGRVAYCLSLTERIAYKDGSLSDGDPLQSQDERASSPLRQPMERRYIVQRVRQVWVILASSVLLTALLQGCPGGGDGGGDSDGSRFAGTWQGTTSQGNNVSFVVANDHTITTVTARAHMTGNGCTAADLSFTPPDGLDITRHITSEPIVGNRFSAVVTLPTLAIFPPPVGITKIVMTGSFANESTASGELQFTANLEPSPCTGTATVTFQARQQ